MGRKSRLNGALKAYLMWPVYLTALLLLMNLVIYVIDKKAGHVMSGFVLAYFLLAGFIFYFRRHQIETNLVRYAMDFAQVQKRLLKEMAIPYRFLMWTQGFNGATTSSWIDFRQKVVGRLITDIIPEITKDKLPRPSR